MRVQLNFQDILKPKQKLGISLHTHAQRHSPARINTHKIYSQYLVSQLLMHSRRANCKLFFMPVRVELGSFSAGVLFLALQKAHGNTCKGAFHLTAGPCSIPEQAKAKETLGSVTNGGVDRRIPHCVHSGRKPKV